MTEDDLRSLLESVIYAKTGGDYSIEPVDEILRLVRTECETRMKALRSAMFAVNVDFAHQVLRAYDRAVGK